VSVDSGQYLLLERVQRGGTALSQTGPKDEGREVNYPEEAERNTFFGSMSRGDSL